MYFVFESCGVDDLLLKLMEVCYVAVKVVCLKRNQGTERCHS